MTRTTSYQTLCIAKLLSDTDLKNKDIAELLNVSQKLVGVVKSRYKGEYSELVEEWEEAFKMFKNTKEWKVAFDMLQNSKKIKT